MNGVAKPSAQDFLKKLSGWIADFLTAVAEARIPPSKTALVPRQGSINILTSGLGVLLYTAAGHVLAAQRNLSLASQFAVVVIGALLLFVAALVVLFLSRRADRIVDEWNRTASIFIIVWLFALVVFALLSYPFMLLSRDFILIDYLAYGIERFITADPMPWRADLFKSMICTFLAGLFLIYRTKRADKHFTLRSAEPWAWLVLMTVVVGFVFFVSMFRLGAS